MNKEMKRKMKEEENRKQEEIKIATEIEKVGDSSSSEESSDVDYKTPKRAKRKNYYQIHLPRNIFSKSSDYIHC